MKTTEQHPRYAGEIVWGALLLAVALLYALFAVGCCTVDPLYLEADRATYEAVAPEYRIYVQEDQALDQEQQDRRQRTLAAWEARIKAAEAEQ